MDPSSFFQKLAPMGVRRDLRHGHGHFIGADNDDDLIAQTIARAAATVRAPSIHRSLGRPHQDVAESRMESHVFGLAMVMPTANVLPWNELFPADSQR